MSRRWFIPWPRKQATPRVVVNTYKRKETDLQKKFRETTDQLRREVEAMARGK